MLSKWIIVDLQQLQPIFNKTNYSSLSAEFCAKLYCSLAETVGSKVWHFAITNKWHVIQNNNRHITKHTQHTTINNRQIIHSSEAKSTINIILVMSVATHHEKNSHIPPPQHYCNCCNRVEIKFWIEKPPKKQHK